MINLATLPYNQGKNKQFYRIIKNVAEKYPLTESGELYENYHDLSSG
jgi:hypothetical protein